MRVPGPCCDITVQRDVMVAMRDGVRLATDVFRPVSGGPCPILIYRTPYSKDEMAANFGFAEWFARRGYVVVQQDCRGCFKSEGDVDFLQPEARDGFDTLQWIADQPWGDADVGSWGTSWSAWTQTAMAALDPPRLKTIVPMMSGHDAYASSVRHGGALELRWIAWAFWHAAENTQSELGKDGAMERALIRPDKRFSDWLHRWPIRRGETQLSLTPAYEKFAFDLIENRDRTAYWSSASLDPRAFMDRIAARSALYIGSWYDSYTRATFENYLAHRAAGGAAHLVVGPWAHGTTTVEQAFAGGVAFTPDAAIESYKAFLLGWFDRELKGKAALDDPPVRLYIMGGGDGTLDTAGRLRHGGRWRCETEWPLARTDYRKFHLHADGTLVPEPPAAEAAARRFRFDPADPVPTIGGNVSSLLDVASDPPDPAAFHALAHKDRTVPIVPAGGFDQRVTPSVFCVRPQHGPLADRPDVLVFQTAVLKEALEIVGPIVVELFVSSDAVDTDFTAKLIDVYPPSAALPDGVALNLTDSIVRLKYRDGSGKPDPVPPGTIVPIRITLYPTANLFAAGHRIRLDISSSNFPRFDVNPNNGDDGAGIRDGVVATNAVHCDAAYPSHILLPVIPS